MLLKVLIPTENENIAHIIKEAFASQPWNDDWTEHETLMQYITVSREMPILYPWDFITGMSLSDLLSED